MKRPNFEPIFTSESDFCEVTSEKPVGSFVPNQAMKIGELVARFERGQRLGVHCNFAPEEEYTRGAIYEENFENAPPICHDVVDVETYYRAHQQHVKEFQERMKKPKQAPQAPVKPAQQGDDTPEDPSK